MPETVIDMGIGDRQGILYVEDHSADLKLLERALRKTLGNNFSLIYLSIVE